MRSLFDVNVLIALLDAAHVHHARAMQWLGDNIRHGWASCPLTQNGCIRILAQPNYPNSVPAVQAAARLREAVRTVHHEFWADDQSLLDDDLFNWTHLLGPRQLTDAYLLALAVRHKGRFVTLDRRVPLAAVPGATAKHLVVI
ncbi:MAG: VapC toxin family PIN domain ribonuclease [Xanthomonadaceae bacterium]|nr:VapC toxin family PIN domain ribonuclease [Xanthomonadaceae bacterium]